jgi:ribose 5-phosphate isomerase B
MLIIVTRDAIRYNSLRHASHTQETHPLTLLQNRRIALASDHAGYPLKDYLVQFLQNEGCEVIDLGVDDDTQRSDYTEAALAVGRAIQQNRADRGILVCGSGVGASIAANKMNGIYCAIAHDTYSAAQGVEHDNMNVLALGARVIGQATAESLVKAFLMAEFDTGTDRYVRRFNQVREIEDNNAS